MVTLFHKNVYLFIISEVIQWKCDIAIPCSQKKKILITKAGYIVSMQISKHFGMLCFLYEPVTLILDHIQIVTEHWLNMEPTLH